MTQNFEEIINRTIENCETVGEVLDEDKIVETPSGNTIKSLPMIAREAEQAISEVVEEIRLRGGYFKTYNTLAEANADIANIPLDATVKVRDAVDGGDYHKATSGASSLTKSPFDSLEQSKLETKKIIAPITIRVEEVASDDTKLLIAIQSLVSIISESHGEVESSLISIINDSALNNTHVTRLLLSLQQLISIVSETRLDLDSAIKDLNSAISSNFSLLSTQSEVSNTSISRLLVALQSIVSIVSESRGEVELSLNNAILNGGVNTENISRLFLSLQQVAGIISDNYRENLQTFDNFFDEDKKLSRLLANHQLTAQLAKLHNFDPEQSGTNKAVTAEGTVFFPNPDNVIRIEIEVTGSLPTVKGTVLQTTTTINVEGQVLSAYGTLEVQGSSSASFPKKNWTLAFFSDVGRTNAIKIKLGGLIPQEELVWKANFVDNTHSRNIAVNRIYDQMQLSRSGFPKREVDFVNMLNPDLSTETTNGLSYQPTGATGHVDGFPAVVYINKEFYGIGTLNIGKKRDNYNLKKDSQTHIQLEANGNVVLPSLPVHPLDSVTESGIDEAFEIRRPATWGAGAQASYERLRNFLTLSQADMQAVGIDNYINRKQMMDYIILCQVCDLWDHLKKNTLFTTWDGNVWSFMPYDLDTVFGLWFTGVYFNADTGVAMRPATGLVIPAVGGTSNFGVLAKFRHIYGAEIDARYAELRKLKIIDVDGIVNLCQSITRKFSAELLAAEDAKWNKGTGTIYTSLQQTSSIHQIHNWLSVRIPRVDTYFNYTA